MLRHLLNIFILSFALLQTTISQTNVCEISWEDAIKLSNSYNLSISAKITNSDGIIHIIWFNLDTNYASPDAGIYYTQSQDNGINFSENTLIIDASKVISPGILTAKGQNVIVACYGIVNEKIGTIICKSTDGGKNWSAPQMIHEGSVPQTILYFNSNIVINFLSMQTKAKGIIVSHDNGDTWNVINSTSPLFSDMKNVQDLLIAVGPANRESGTEVGFYTSINGGISWYGPDILSANDQISSLQPKIAASANGNMYVTWHEAGTILLRRSRGYDMDGNIIWYPLQIISSGASNAFPNIAVYNNAVAVVWESGEQWNKEINLRFSGDGSISFCPVAFPSPSPGGSEPDIIITPDTIHLIWTLRTEEGTDIYYRRGRVEEFYSLPQTMLGRIYPNPSSLTATVEVYLTSSEYIEIDLFNTIGQKIKKVYKGISGPGLLTIHVNVTDIPSGVYFFNLKTIKGVDTKKSLILH